MMECMKSMAKKPQTNADRIRSMTDEELLDFMCSVTDVEQWLKAESEEVEAKLKEMRGAK